MLSRSQLRILRRRARAAGTSARGFAQCRKITWKNKQTSDLHSEEHFDSRFCENQRVSVVPLGYFFSARTRLWWCSERLWFRAAGECAYTIWVIAEISISTRPFNMRQYKVAEIVSRHIIEHITGSFYFSITPRHVRNRYRPRLINDSENYNGIFIHNICAFSMKPFQFIIILKINISCIYSCNDKSWIYNLQNSNMTMGWNLI